MEPLPRTSIIQRLCRGLGSDCNSGPANSVLLERFLNDRDEAAFEVLVWRHSAVVMGACRRLLRHEQDAEDAFQATFLTLARKAASISKRESLSSWLFKVAYRCALAVRRRLPKEIQTVDACEPTDPASSPGAGWADLRPVIDEEVDSLPTRYRVPFVLCCVEGKTLEEAAEQLGSTKGTVSSWLCRGKDRLRDRLAKRGIALSAGSVAALVTQDLASASVPVLLVEKAVRVGLLATTSHAPAVAVPSSIAMLSRHAVRSLLWSRFIAFVLMGCIGIALLGTVAAVYVARSATAVASSSRREALPLRVDLLPEGLLGFRGSLSGRLVSKDLSRGSLVLEITSVRPSPGSKATEPQRAIGKSLEITRVFGKFLETLATLQEGDGTRIAVHCLENDELQFFGEELVKTDVPSRKH